MDFRKITNETAIYSLAFGLALFLRLLLLGAAPLSDAEASWALQALAVARGQPVVVGPDPGYILLTGMLFEVFGDGNSVARLIPALAGSLLVLAPFLVRPLLGRKAALLLAFALAIDPGLLALSRQAGSGMVAISMGVLAVCAWFARRPRLAGVTAGLALLGGQAVWPGLIGLAAAGLLGSRLLKDHKHTVLAEEIVEPAGVPVEAGNGQTQQEVLVTVPESIGTPVSRKDVVEAVEPSDGGDEKEGSVPLPHPAPRMLTMAMVFAVASFAIVGTLFFRYPQGVSAAAASLPGYIQSWFQPASTPRLWWFLALLIYQSVPLVFGLAGIGRGWVSGLRVERWLSLWALVALLIAVLNPARQPADLAWVVIPLWAAAAREIARHLHLRSVEPFPVIGQAVITLIVMAFLWLNLNSLLVSIDNNLPNVYLYYLVLLGALVLLLASGYLIYWGWSMRAALRGLVWGLVAALALYTIAAGSHAGGYRPARSPELWSSSPVPGQVDLLVSTANDLSVWRFTRRGAIDVTAAGIDSASLQWAFRDFQQARFVNFLEPGTMPSLVITPQEDQPELTAGYRGQDFILSQAADWRAFSPIQWLEWLVYRKAPTIPQSVILWARIDLFPAGNTPPPTGGAQ